VVDTAYVKSAKGWYYCEDSKITKSQEKDVVVSVAGEARALVSADVLVETCVYPVSVP
jgi:hypothetical protein